MYLLAYTCMDTTLLVGYLGTLGLILAWVLAAYKDAKIHKAVIDVHFSIIYIIGNGLLLVYALLINDMVFIILEVFLVLAISIETIYAVKSGKHKRRKRR